LLPLVNPGISLSLSLSQLLYNIPKRGKTIECQILDINILFTISYVPGVMLGTGVRNTREFFPQELSLSGFIFRISYHIVGSIF
jgi:hypothetical protein